MSVLQIRSRLLGKFVISIAKLRRYLSLETRFESYVSQHMSQGSRFGLKEGIWSLAIRIIATGAGGKRKSSSML